MDEQQIFNQKVAFLQQLADEGILPSEAGRRLRLKHAAEQSQAKTAGWIPGAVQTGLALPLLLGAGATGLGYLGGHAAEKLTGPNQSDVRRQQLKNQIDALRRADLRLESQQEDDDDESKRRGRNFSPQSLEILSA